MTVARNMFLCIVGAAGGGAGYATGSIYIWAICAFLGFALVQRVGWVIWFGSLFWLISGDLGVNKNIFQVFVPSVAVSYLGSVEVGGGVGTA